MQSDSKTSSSQKCFAVVSFWIEHSEMKNLLAIERGRFLANASEWQKATALKNACHSEHNIAEWRISYQNMSFWMERSEMKNLNLSSSNMIPRIRSEWNNCHSERQHLEESPAKWAYCENSHIRSRWQAMSFWRPKERKNLFSTNECIGIPYTRTEMTNEQLSNPLPFRTKQREIKNPNPQTIPLWTKVSIVKNLLPMLR